MKIESKSTLNVKRKTRNDKRNGRMTNKSKANNQRETLNPKR